MEYYRRKGDIGENLRIRLPGILLLLSVVTICIALMLPQLAPIPEDLEPLRMQLKTGSDNTQGGIQYIDAGSMLDMVIVADGCEIELRTVGGTVEDALEQAGITLGTQDLLSCEVGDRVFAGMMVTVTRVTTETITQEVQLKYDTDEIPNDRMLVGETIVLKEGVNGTAQETWEIEYHDGQEVGRTLTESVVTRETTTAVVEVGTYVLPTVDTQTQTLTFEDGTVLKYSKLINVGATAYSCEGKSFNITKTGTIARVGAIAVDPRVIPLGSKLYVQAPDGSWFYGVCTAEDTGGKINGKRIDLYYDTIDECVSFGYRNAQVYIIEEE